MGGLSLSHRSRNKRQAVWDMTNGRCFYCGVEIDPPTKRGTSGRKTTFHVDHVIPRILGGSDHISNLVPSCPTCNTSKNGSLLCEWEKRSRPLYPFGRHPLADVLATRTMPDLQKQLNDAEIRAARAQAEAMYWKDECSGRDKVIRFWRDLSRSQPAKGVDGLFDYESKLRNINHSAALLRQENEKLRAENKKLRSEVDGLKHRLKKTLGSRIKEVLPWAA